MGNFKKKILIYVVNVDWFFLSHRLPLALAALDKGFKVIIITRNTGKFDEIKNHGLDVIDIKFHRSGRNPISEIQTIKKLVSIYKKIKPDIVHHVTLKVSIYGSIAAKMSNVPIVVNAISGLGYSFTSNRKGITEKVLNLLIKYAFNKDDMRFIFQNLDDLNVFNHILNFKEKQVNIIKGSGIDLSVYKFVKPNVDDKKRILFPARMLKDKGLKEFVNAAKLCKNELKEKIIWILAGGIDNENLAGYNETEIKAMLETGYIEWIGFQQDMKIIYQRSEIIILPSYREGLPKSLIEASAIGRPIITTNVPGCRECVKHGINGYLVPIYDSEQIALNVKKLIDDESLRLKMGKESRKLAEKYYSLDSVIEKTMSIYES